MLRGRLISLRRAPQNYVVAAAFVAVAFGIRFALEPVLQDRSPYLPFVFAVAITAIYCGVGSAFMAMVAGLILSLYYFVPPHHHFLPTNIGELAHALMYVVPSLLIIALAEVAERDRERIRHAADRFRLLTEQAREYAVITLDAQGLILTWSNGAEHLFGYRDDEVLGRRTHILFTEEDRKNRVPEEEVRQAIQEGHAPCERWLPRRDGTRFFGLGILVPLRNDEGKVIEFAKILRDGTHLKRREEQLTKRAQTSESALAETTQHIDAFTYTVAHDLRAPLRAMDGYAKALQDEFGEQLAPEGREYLTRILNAAYRMDELVSDLLEFWRLTRMREPNVRVDANAILERVLADFAPQITAKRAQIQKPKPLPVVLGHSECLYKAFSHLVSNSLKFSLDGKDPHIEIGCEERDGFVRIYFKDDGPGVPFEYQNKIFRVFERINKEKPGTGIGLSIVHKCAELMHGRAGVESKPGDGSCFWIELRPPENGQQKSATRSAPPGNASLAG
jgi:PAS domain S-box-containing protein